MDKEEGFFGRWSRLKADARSVQPPSEPAGAPASAPCADAPARLAEDAPPPLPPIESLTIDSDYRAFFHPKVDENLRRSALRKLFSDPHFNVMDGLDVYIDDYSVSEPLAPAMLAGLKQAQRILRWAEGHDDETSEEAVASGAENAGTEVKALAQAPAPDIPQADAPPADPSPLSVEKPA